MTEEDERMASREKRTRISSDKGWNIVYERRGVRLWNKKLRIKR